MVVVPEAIPLAKPALEMVATEVLDEDQVTELVMFWVVASEKIPVAVYC